MLHPDSRERDKLLNILFNLIKKPDEEQRFEENKFKSCKSNYKFCKFR
jgi:hypothetical protein